MGLNRMTNKKAETARLKKMNKFKLDKVDKAIIKSMEKDIPLTINPYQKIADQLNIELVELLDRLKKLKQQKILKRVAAILYHRQSGYQANGMFVCFLPDVKLTAIANKISSLKEVSHCYQRKTYPEWPYNFYAMFHAKNKSVLEDLVVETAAKHQINDYQILYSTEELKKSSLKYFTNDFDI